jgi:hypothetical protein
MTKKRLALMAVLPLTVAAVFGVLAMLPPRPGVTKANFDCIRDGMTISEVEELFGEQPPDIGTGIGIDGWTHYWTAKDGSRASVSFLASNECVCSKEWMDSNETILDTIRRWLHLKEPDAPPVFIRI